VRIYGLEKHSQKLVDAYNTINKVEEVLNDDILGIPTNEPKGE